MEACGGEEALHICYSVVGEEEEPSGGPGRRGEVGMVAQSRFLLLLRS